LSPRNFETERYTAEKHEIKSLDLQEIYLFDLGFVVVSHFVPKSRRFKTIGTVDTFLECLYPLWRGVPRSLCCVFTNFQDKPTDSHKVLVEPFLMIWLLGNVS